MYWVEKIGNLILITVIDDITSDEVENIKSQLTGLTESSKENSVVSINQLSQFRNNKSIKSSGMEASDLLKFCHLSGLQVYIPDYSLSN
ncbi:MAG: hypothetical protein ACM3SY_19010 [Candidatus Omnitrophota bacterium]